MIKIKDFWEGEAQIYDEAIKEELKGKFAPQWKKLILDNSPKTDRLKVLDIGTGPEFFPVLLAQEGHDVTGIDVTENMIKWAKHNAENCGVEATLLTMDTHKLDFEDNSFDVIVNRNVTWTLENPKDASLPEKSLPTRIPFPSQIPIRPVPVNSPRKSFPMTP